MSEGLKPRHGASVKPRWNRKPCGCVKTELPSVGPVMIRCERHEGKPSKKHLVCHLEDGIVRVSA